jgi:hypothetical protein
MIVLSLGWGVQSFALAAMSALGELPRVDVVIHSDTGWERAETMAFAARWTPWLEEHGVRVVTVHGTHNDCAGECELPAFTVPLFVTVLATNSGGMLRRQCTSKWKIGPMRAWERANCGKDDIEKWIGITRDEAGRMRSSGLRHVRHVYPFIESFNPPMSRNDVVHWLISRGLEVPVKSGCIICPYHSRGTWRDIQRSENGDWQRAIAVDAAIRDSRPNCSCFLSSQRRPLAECDFSAPEDNGQMMIWEECSGMCFV